MANPTNLGTLAGKLSVGQWVLFRVLDGSNVPVTGLLDASFTKKLSRLTAYKSLTVTVYEMDSINLPGFYGAYFTPDDTGLWFLVITHATHMVAGVSWTIDINLKTINELAPDIYECIGGFTYDPTASPTELHVTAMVHKNGQIQTAPTSCTVKVYADSASPLFTLVSAVPDANGVFRMVQTTPGLSAGKTHSLEIEIVLPGVSPNPKTVIPMMVQQVA